MPTARTSGSLFRHQDHPVPNANPVTGSARPEVPPARPKLTTRDPGRLYGRLGRHCLARTQAFSICARLRVVCSLLESCPNFSGPLLLTGGRSLELDAVAFKISQVDRLRAGHALIDIVPTDEAGPARGTSSTGGANLDHLCLGVEPFDAMAIAEHLAGQGVACGAETLRYGAEGKGPSDSNGFCLSAQRARVLKKLLVSLLVSTDLTT
jgi:hypothetical protein